MVKADIKRDYYADLELEPNADNNDVKKQFKKFALLYHPDRNPGKEADFAPKFQIIQSAHEVLCDPLERAKYDAARIKSGYSSRFATTPTRRSNMGPPRTSQTAYQPQPPPRRTHFAASAPFTAPRPSAARPVPPPSSTRPQFPTSSTTTPTSGANRYAPFAGAEGTPLSNSRADAQARADAWSRMKYPHEQPYHPVPPQPARESAFQSGRETSNNVPKASVPPVRPGYQEFSEQRPGPSTMPRTHSTYAPKRTGFAPSTPGGDEPPAHNNSAYSNVSQGNRPSAFRAQTVFGTPPRGQAPTARKPDPLGRFKQAQAEEFLDESSDRISTPYATAGGEKTYFSSMNLGRSASTREPQKKTEWNGSGHGKPNGGGSPGMAERHRSSSPIRRRPFSGTSSSSGGSLHPNVGGFRDESRPRSRESEEAKKAEHGSRSEMRFQTSPGSETSSSDSQEANDARSDRSWQASVGESVKERVRKSRRHPRKSDSRQGFDRGPEDTTSSRNHSKEVRQSSSNVHLPKDTGPPLEKTRSWHEHIGKCKGAQDVPDRMRWNPSVGVKNQQNGTTAGGTKTGNQDSGPEKDSPTMYGSEYFKSSSLWSSRWPFGPGNSKKPQSSSSAFTTPPYWAFPSTILPPNPASQQAPASFLFSSDTNQWYHYKNSANNLRTSSFTMPVDDSTFAGPPPAATNFRSNSSDNINTRFSPSEWSGKFTGNSNEYFTGPQTAGRKDAGSRSRTSPVRGRPHSRPPSPVKTQPAFTSQESLVNGAPKIPPPKDRPILPPSPGPAKFSPAEWTQHFKDPTWAGPPPPAPPSPGKRPQGMRTRAPSKSTTTRKNVPITTKLGATIVDDPGEDVVLGYSKARKDREGRSFSDGVHDDDNAMDIDSTPPQERNRSVDVNGQKEPRYVSVEPTRPERRAEDGPSKSTPIAPTKPSSISPVPSRSGPPPMSQTGTSHLNLGDLNNVEPLAAGNHGLKDLKDLASTLPFESRPSGNPPDQRSGPQRLELPRVPRAPTIPPAPTDLNDELISRYFTSMQAYFSEWNIFHKTMLAHFTSRQHQVQNELSPDWILQSPKGNEYKKYMSWIEEDMRVRQHWDIAWERHREAMKGFGGFREACVKMHIRNDHKNGPR
ncbi:MAG: hypothetical protein M1827_007260 [Pycnora praestabilis]|nr:MAG: hypothetical protein M1827_007260 [Pycnora praestabilis]